MPTDLEAIRNNAGDLPAYTHGYPFAYVTADSEYLCAACANGGNGSRAAEQLDADCPDDDQWRVIGYDVLEEPADDDVRCAHCNTIILPRMTHSRVTADGVSYELWTDGYAVGFKVTHLASMAVEYVYLNPSSASDDGQPTVFLYHGAAGDPAADAPLLHVNIHGAS